MASHQHYNKTLFRDMLDIPLQNSNASLWDAASEPAEGFRKYATFIRFQNSETHLVPGDLDRGIGNLLFIWGFDMFQSYDQH